MGDPPTARCDPLRIFTKKGEQPWTPKGAVARPDAIPLATMEAQGGGCVGPVRPCGSLGMTLAGQGGGHSCLTSPPEWAGTVVYFCFLQPLLFKRCRVPRALSRPTPS